MSETLKTLTPPGRTATERWDLVFSGFGTMRILKVNRKTVDVVITLPDEPVPAITRVPLRDFTERYGDIVMVRS